MQKFCLVNIGKLEGIAICWEDQEVWKHREVMEGREVLQDQEIQVVRKVWEVQWSWERCPVSQVKGDAMNLTLTFQNNMVGVVLGFSINHAFLWCQWLPMDENYFLRWSLNMTRPQRICYSLRANGARNGVISIGQWGVFNHEKGVIWQSHLAAQKEGVVTTIIFSNHKPYSVRLIKPPLWIPLQTPLQNTRLHD